MPYPSSPPTPTRRPKSSSTAIQLSLTCASPQSDGDSPKQSSNGQTSSQCSIASSSTPRPISPHDRSGYFESFNGLNDLTDPERANGLGNLADELAEALDEQDGNGYELEDGGRETLYDRTKAISHDQLKDDERAFFSNATQERHAVSVSPVRQATSDEIALGPPKTSSCSRHIRKNSQYDGSDYGNDSDLDDTRGVSASLEARLAAVESLARRGTEANGSDVDEIVQRVADSLNDLGSQAGVENGARR